MSANACIGAQHQEGSEGKVIKDNRRELRILGGEETQGERTCEESTCGDKTPSPPAAPSPKKQRVVDEAAELEKIRVELEEWRSRPLPDGITRIPLPTDWLEEEDDDDTGSGEEMPNTYLRQVLYSCEHALYEITPKHKTDPPPHPGKRWYNAAEIDEFENWVVLGAYRVPKLCPSCR
eukprot:TRINITY_DN66941_c3_g1_i1.p1 TRINITY_DN66941_c3_g1~~TRINITY_DN66941_c3_g1_i1.p1  ORF type:complete len:178 (+),score=23.71 TRINITY_DN66941_c3_g1_i1:25-558(+)